MIPIETGQPLNTRYVMTQWEYMNRYFHAAHLGAALRLPTFVFEGAELYKRVTLVLEAAHVAKVFYPVFPPDRNAEDVIAWLAERSSS